MGGHQVLSGAVYLSLGDGCGGGLGGGDAFGAVTGGHQEGHCDDGEQVVRWYIFHGGTRLKVVHFMCFSSHLPQKYTIFRNYENGPGIYFECVSEYC